MFINRSKVVKGGRRFKFSALVVVGDKKGRVGLGLGKATELLTQSVVVVKTPAGQMTSVSLKDATIPHEIFCEFDGAKICSAPSISRNWDYRGQEPFAPYWNLSASVTFSQNRSVLRTRRTW